MDHITLKVQRPIFTNAKEEEWLAYSLGGDIYFIFDPNEVKNIRKLMGDDYKMFVEAEMRHKKLKIIKRVEYQEW